MYRVTSVEVVEAFRCIQQLGGASVSIRYDFKGGTYEGDPIRARIFADVMGQGAVRHPFRNKL